MRSPAYVVDIVQKYQSLAFIGPGANLAPHRVFLDWVDLYCYTMK